MNRRNLKVVRLLAIGLSLTLALTLSAGSAVAKKDHGKGPFLFDWPVLENNPPVGKGRVKQAEKKARKILAGLTLEQKIGQITQGEIQAVTPADVQQYCLGSVLNGGGSWPNLDKNASPKDWRDLADAYWQAGMDGCGIPPIWGIDSVHGNNNVIGATLFPHNIGLGAANNPKLMKKIGQATAKETRATGQPWVFAPTVAVARDDRWGRTYESYSEDPKRVSRLAAPMIKGLQGRLGKCSVAATIKHWVGDGGTTNGEDQGDTEVPEDELINIHALPYFKGMKAGVLSAMPSFSSWNGEKMHGNQYLLNDILKDTLGFSGHIISDWNGIAQVTDCSESDCPQAVNAGIDLFMVPFEWPAFIATTKQQVLDGTISMERIDDAVKRILRNKILLGLFNNKPSQGRCAKDKMLGKKEHREIARQAVRESLVLLKNDGNILPLDRDARILVTGKSAHNLSNQSGGWTLTWQGTGNTNEDFPGATSIYEGIAAVAPNAELVEDLTGVDLTLYDVAVIAIGEAPYAEGLGDIRTNQTLEHAKLHPEDLAVLQTIHDAGAPIVTLWIAGRPLYVNKELNRSNAFVAAWLPGSEGGGIADVIFALEKASHSSMDWDGDKIKGRYDFTGTLPFSWPGEDCQTPLNVGQHFDALFPYYFGLTYKDDVSLGMLDETSGDLGCGLRNGDPGDGDVATEPLEVFVQGGNIDPWVLQLGDPSNWGGTAVDLSDPNNVTALENVKAGPRVDSPTFQSGGITVTWTGGPGQFYSQGDGAAGEDLTPYINAPNSALVYNVRSNAAPTFAVKTRVDCVFPCIGELDLTPAYTDISDGDWHELAVPLSCFETAGTDFSNVNTPFLVFTEGAWAADFATIRWEPDRDGNVTCEGQYQP
ncbi:MAG: glycoside hydrolase family 3 protein [bacterium]|nr:glycoside hydrolase family 3 protein [bacterium]